MKKRYLILCNYQIDVNGEYRISITNQYLGIEECKKEEIDVIAECLFDDLKGSYSDSISLEYFRFKEI